MFLPLGRIGNRNFPKEYTNQYVHNVLRFLGLYVGPSVPDNHLNHYRFSEPTPRYLLQSQHLLRHSSHNQGKSNDLNIYEGSL
jgi:hypothetical protein